MHYSHSSSSSQNSRHRLASPTQDTCPILQKKTSWPPFLDKGPDFPHVQIKIIIFTQVAWGRLALFLISSKGATKRRGPFGYHGNNLKQEEQGGASQRWCPRTNWNNPWRTNPIDPTGDKVIPLCYPPPCSSKDSQRKQELPQIRIRVILHCCAGQHFLRTIYNLVLLPLPPKHTDISFQSFRQSNNCWEVND